MKEYNTGRFCEKDYVTMVDRIQIMFGIYAEHGNNANYDSEKLRAKNSSRLYHLKILGMEHECR